MLLHHLPNPNLGQRISVDCDLGGCFRGSSSLFMKTGQTAAGGGSNLKAGVQILSVHE